MKYETKKVDVYYEWIQKLTLQILTTNSFLNTMFRAGLQSYIKIMTTRMKWLTLQKHKEATMLCEEEMTTIKTRNAL